MRRMQRFWAGFALVLCSALIYAWHDHGGRSMTGLDLVWHGGLLLVAIALLVPRAQYRATLDFLGAVLRPSGKDGAQ